MTRPPRSTPALRSGSAGLFALLATAPSAHALLRLNDGRDQVYVTAYAGVGYDTNIFTSKNAESDLVVSGGAGMEYSRKAGLIGVNGSLGWNFGSFATFSSENFLNPSASLEFSKGTGRTTGSLQLNSTRDSRADPTVGLRTESWSYGANLNLRYPVIERYSIAGNAGWSRVDYQDEGINFSDIDTYTLGGDLFYTWRSDRDLVGGYRYRTSSAQFQSTSFDHSFYGGLSGRILSKLSGSARLGWSTRTVEYPGPVAESTNDGLYVSLSGTWPVSQRISVTLTLLQDFSTSSSNFETQTSSADLMAQFAHTSKLTSNVSMGVGTTEFISGFSPSTGVPTDGFNGSARSDYYITLGCGVSYSFNEHYTASVSYTYYQNFSNLARFEFFRQSISASLSARW